MVARDEGIFAKHNLDVDLKLIGINTNIPPAIVSDSIQIGGPTEPVFLQAVSGGLDLVAIAGATIMQPSSNELIAAVARTGDTIKDAKDFVGKKSARPASAPTCTCCSANGWSRRAWTPRTSISSR